MRRYTPKPINPERPRHPILALKKDEVLSFILKPLIDFFEDQQFSKYIIDFNKWIQDMVFDKKDISKIKNRFQSLSIPTSSLCGGVIDEGEIYFWCVDCEIPGKSNIFISLCSSCFEKANHDGHRIFMMKNDTPTTCTCGDDYYIKAENSCPDHQPRHFALNEILHNFPKEVLERCSTILPKVFYAIVALFEIAQATQNGRIKEKILNLAEQVTDGVLKFCSMCYTELNEAFLTVFSLVFRDNFKSPYNYVWHDCDNLKGKHEENLGESSHICQCTILGNLFRLGNSFGREQQSSLQKILLECSKETQFAEFSVIEITKYAFFLHGQDYANDDNTDTVNSNLSGLIPEYYVRENLRLKVLDSGYFVNLIEILRQAIQNSPEISWGLFYIVSRIRSAMTCFLEPHFGSCAQILKETPLLKELTDLIGIFQTRFVYDKKNQLSFSTIEGYRKINLGLLIEKGLLNIIEKGVDIICDYRQETKSLLINDFLDNWNQNFQMVSSILNQEFQNGAVNFHFGLERVFCYTIANYCLTNSMKGIEELIQKIIPHSETKALIENILANSLRVIGMMRYLRIKHINYNGNLRNVYYHSYKIFEADVFSAQIMSFLSDPRFLFETFVENFFSYNQDIQNFFVNLEAFKKDIDFKQKVSAIQDFLNFLIYIMNDELCLFNLTVEEVDSLVNGENKNPRFKNVVEKTLINLLLGHGWIEFAQLNRLTQEVLKEDYKIDAILNKIAIIDQRTQKIKIKEEYYSEFDPYIFYRKPLTQDELTRGFAAKTKKNQQIDLISGKFYTDLPEYLKSIQKNLFLGTLPSFLSLVITKFTEQTIPFIRPVLKLILFNLQLAEEAIKNHDNSAKALLELIKVKYYLQEFQDKLKKIAKVNEFKDCFLCITKIQGLLHDLFCNDHEEKSSFGKASLTKEEVSDKKSLFANKIAKAQDKAYNSEDFKAGELVDKEEHIKCNHCLKEIQKSHELYGMPIYLTFTNNMYDTEIKEAFDIKSQNADRWWPVISSCRHFYHNNCFETVYRNSRDPSEQAPALLTNAFETFCPLCKALSNYFICVNSENFVGGQKQNGNYGSLSQGVELILDSKVRKFKNLTSNAKDIFQRAYEYFFEGFYLNSQPKEMQKTYLLYQSFFQVAVNELTTQNSNRSNFEKAPVFPVSFLDVIISKTQKVLNLNTDPSESATLQEYECEPTLNEVFFSQLNGASNSRDLYLGLVRKSQISVLKDYLIFKMLQSLVFEKGNKPNSIVDIKPFFEDNKNLFYSILRQLAFPIQKIVLASWLNRNILFSKLDIPDNLWTVLSQSERNDIEYIDMLLKLLEPSLSPTNLLEEILTEIITRPKHEILLLNTMLVPRNKDMKGKKSRVIKLAPKMIELPKNYGEFVTKYLKVKCNLCKKFSQYMNNCICLICGMVICEARCGQLSQSGNLNKHAKSHHMGLSIFFEVQGLRQISIDSPLNSDFVAKHPYIDQFGRSIQGIISEMRKTTCGGNLIDFRNYTLNEQFVDYVKDIIYRHDMGKEAFKTQILIGRYLPQGYL